MKAWILFLLFIIVGLGMFVTGIIYMKKEKTDVESVRIYRNISIIGVVLAVVSIVVKFLL